MLFSDSNDDGKTELRLRKLKATEVRTKKRSLRILVKERVKRYDDTLTVKEDVDGVLSDCVEAVCTLDTEREVNPEEKVFELVEPEKPNTH